MVNVKYLSEEAINFFKSKKLLFAAWACENNTNDSYQIFYPYIKNLFGKTIVFDPQKHLYCYGKDRMNKNFLRIVEKEKPDYIFLWLIYEEFCPETLIKIRQVSPKTKIINFFGDDDTQFETFTRYFSLLIDYLLCFPQKRKKDYQKEKIKNVFFTRMVNTNVFKPLNVNKKYDITFVGTPKSDRAELLYYLKKKGIKIRIFGAGWERYPEFKEAYLGRLNNEDFIKVINQSKINLCLSKNYLNKLHVKGRIFNVSACKSFALLEYFKDYYKFFSKDEIVMFKDKEDLLNKIRYYLKNEEEREKIAERAYKKVIKKYNLEVELGNFFNKVYSERDIPPKTNLPNMDGRVLSLGIENLNSRYIAEKLKDVDYIKFSDENEECSTYRNYFQMYSIKKSGKPISCCDYYIYSKGLGNYLLFNSYFSFRNLEKHKFSAIVNKGQLMVEKNYFFRNIDKFRKTFLGKDAEIINSKNTAFVNIPLIRMINVNEFAIKNITDLFSPLFENFLRNVCYNKSSVHLSFIYNLLFSNYPYKKLVIKHSLKKFIEFVNKILFYR